jgi:hypothetical protein
MATIPSIAMIPSGYKASKVYSVLPTDGAGDLTFSRAGALPSFNATRVNSDGLIEQVLSNVPRFDYSDGGCPSLLIEPQSRNLLLRSEEFDNASWVKLGQGTGSIPIVTPNYAISPDGTQNASRLQCDLNGGNTTSDRSWLYQSITDVVVESTFSLYVKNISSETIIFTLNNGSSGTVSVSPDSQWHRLYSVKTGGTQPRIGLIGGVGASDNADLLIWGAQLEALPYATSYIPTVASTVTRVAETVSKTGISSLINSSEGVLYLEMAALANSGNARLISISDGTETNRFWVGIDSNNKFYYFFTVGGSNQSNFASTIDANTTSKVALKYSQNNFSFWINGVKINEDFSGNVPNVNTFNTLEFKRPAGNPFYGKVKNLQVYPTALSDLEIETITSYTSFEEMALALDYTIEITL